MCGPTNQDVLPVAKTLPASKGNTNMATQVLVQVTRDDIQYGTRSSESACPIARAVARATGKQAHVSGTRIKIGANTLSVRRLPTTPKQAKFVRDFDNNAKVEPFDFWMDLE